MPNRKYFTDEQRAAWRRDGFVVVRGLFDAAEMEQITAWTEEIEALPEVPGKCMMYFEPSLKEPGQRLLNRVENFYPYHQGFAALIDGAKMRARISELFGEPAVLFKDKINFKKPGGDGFKPHQDQQAGWGEYAEIFITALVSIDEATIESGCLEVTAGHHDRGLIGSEWTPLTEEERKDMNLAPYPTKPGDAMFFSSYTPHGSKANLSDRQRRVLYISYNRRSEGDHRLRYYEEKRQSYPPDCEREPGKEYVFRV